MEEDIKILEEMKNALWVYFEDFKIDKDTSSTMKKIYEIRKAQVTALENLIKGYRELEEENKRLKGKIDVCDWQEKSCREIIDEKYIPVSLVEEKIEELNKLLEEDLQDERKVNSNRFIIICQCKNCLQELLEKRK